VFVRVCVCASVRVRRLAQVHDPHTDMLMDTHTQKKPHNTAHNTHTHATQRTTHTRTQHNAHNIYAHHTHTHPTHITHTPHTPHHTHTYTCTTPNTHTPQMPACMHASTRSAAPGDDELHIYRKLCARTLRWPPGMSPAACSLVDGLLQLQPSDRLGAGEGAACMEGGQACPHHHGLCRLCARGHTLFFFGHRPWSCVAHVRVRLHVSVCVCMCVRK